MAPDGENFRAINAVLFKGEKIILWIKIADGYDKTNCF
jgi:hypothetical protein